MYYIDIGLSLNKQYGAPQFNSIFTSKPNAPWSYYCVPDPGLPHNLSRYLTDDIDNETESQPRRRIKLRLTIEVGLFLYGVAPNISFCHLLHHSISSVMMVLTILRVREWTKWLSIKSS